MIENVFAAIVLAACLVLLLRLVIGPQRRYRLDAFAVRAWQGLRRGALTMWHWPRQRRRAKALAKDAIRRASQVERDGNVYRPDQFKRPPRDKMH